MQINPHPIAVTAPPAPSAPTAPSSALQSDDSAFAKLLSARQAAPHHDAAKPATDKTCQASNDAAHDKAPKKSADDTQACEQPQGRQTVPAKKAQSPSRRSERADPAQKKTLDASTETPTADAKDTPAAGHDKDKTPDPSLAEWIATLSQPVPQTPSANPRGGAQPAELPASESAQGKGLPRAELLAARADAARSDARDARMSFIEQRGERVGFDSAMLNAIKDSADAPQRIEPPTPIETAMPNTATALNPTPRSDEAAAPVAVDLPTPATSPEFRAAFGVQVSVLARDGVQHAQLHLNPAEMGPISVQIALDGTQARVDFGADSAATRQIIETSLPELAAALRDAGLTLSGGGVSQHSQSKDGQSKNEHANHSLRVGGLESDSELPAARVNLRLPLGAVDLYA